MVEGLQNPGSQSRVYLDSVVHFPEVETPACSDRCILFCGACHRQGINSDLYIPEYAGHLGER